MRSGKVTPRPAKGKKVLLQDFDHFVSVDWSQQTMAIAHMRRRDKEPVVFERASDLKALKEYKDVRVPGCLQADSATGFTDFGLLFDGGPR